MKATKKQIDYILFVLKNFKEETLELPIPNELISYALGKKPESEARKVLESYSIKKANNIISVLNNYIKQTN